MLLYIMEGSEGNEVLFCARTFEIDLAFDAAVGNHRLPHGFGKIWRRNEDINLLRFSIGFLRLVRCLGEGRGDEKEQAGGEDNRAHGFLLKRGWARNVLNGKYQPKQIESMVSIFTKWHLRLYL